MALVVRATRPWKVARHSLFRQTIVSASSCRYGSSSASESSSEPSLFPWRHSPDPIKRVVDKDNLSGLPIGKQDDTFFQQVMLGSMLHRDWYELLLPSVWKDSLANDCAWAFQKGLAALFSRVFRVPADEIDKEDLGIVFDTENLDAPSKSTQAEDGENQETEEETDSKPPEEDADSKSPEEDADSKPPKEDAESKASEENVEEEEMQCSLMLEKKLIELYTNAVDPSTTDLLLCLKPLSSKLENVFSVIFTREAVEEDSSLAEAGRKMRYESRVTRNPMEVSRMLKDLDDKQKPIALFTIMADVSIQCLETFAVKDKSTGTIVSGSTDPQEVTHLVRFEVTTDLDGGRHLGSWRIVDWDDLLEGNVWY